LKLFQAAKRKGLDSKPAMTTIEIIKKGEIDSVNKGEKSFTVTGIDSVTGRRQKRTFSDILPRVLDKAEHYAGTGNRSLVVEVDSGTKNIDLRQST
jgi:hypothetical protein